MNINGKEISLKRKDELKIKIEELKKAGKRIPKLVVILVGDNQASQTYVRNKEKACEYVGMLSEVIRLDASLTEETLMNVIKGLNKDENVDGILVQLPLPQHIHEEKILDLIDSRKDVDGFHPSNVAKLLLGQDGLVPCTPQGMMVLLDEINYDLTGKEVVVVGRSNIVGKPVALLCLHKNATVTIAHSRTSNLKEVCKRADVLIAAIGQAKFFNHEYIKEGAVVLDVGMDRDENNKLCGDVDFDDVKEIASYITPVPGGVGPMTIAMLMENTLQAYTQREG
ncbi:bifunctional methylenetetrahydrofolate dehydrogenase/methenyltetrahydrofolate cyclohydrolase FolD [Candidatus Stoquefichus massiliensis]|uniref:bifunctional methylenetetrahydrofolate dehydrogenase/methenyltetrahydrofolate cyclohydrolase FolD n=1 Tax=Candidatus Stoquefichus massiliensis TaxID=1470350 RepID=UPI000482EDFF|nr:bifunctional methylenetetrahydrofolate dehydrogenase/methenyltetrahydrofolate cyclohydrolase FolD [Candidatus Stoquefichus massiliensis]